MPSYGRREAAEMMRKADALLRAGAFDEVDRLLDVSVDYTIRQRLALLTTTLFAGDKLSNRAAFYDECERVLPADRGKRLLAGLKEPS